VKGRNSKPRAASPGSKPRASVRHDVMADVNLLWRKLCELDNARQRLSWEGKDDLDFPYEWGWLAARGLDDLDMPVPEKYTGHDPYQRDIFRSRGRIDFGTFKAAESPQDWARKAELLTRHLRMMVRDPNYLADMREAAHKAVEARMQMLRILGETARLTRR